MSMLGVVIPTLSNFKGLAELFASISHPIYPVVIPNWVNNWSVAHSWNIGYGRAVDAGCEHILIVNDDVVLRPDSIEQMLRLCNNAVVSGIHGYACFMVDKHFRDKVGIFDENFKPAYFEDNDMRYRAKLAGIPEIDVEFPAKHTISATKKLDPHNAMWNKTFLANREYYVRKWGGLPGQEKYLHPHNDLSLTFKDWK